MGILGLPCILHPNEFGHNMLSSKGPWKPISMPDHLIGKMEEKPSDPFIGEMDEWMKNPLTANAFLIRRFPIMVYHLHPATS